MWNKFRSVGRPTDLNIFRDIFIPEYFSYNSTASGQQNTNFALILAPSTYSCAMDANSQTRGGRAAGQPIGAPNYNNNILIEVVERYLPQGLEAWRAVALAYQRESMEAVLRRGEDLRDNWNKKLCNRMQKPTGKPGENTDRINRCIEIERRIQDEAATAPHNMPK